MISVRRSSHFDSQGMICFISWSVCVLPTMSGKKKIQNAYKLAICHVERVSRYLTKTTRYSLYICNEPLKVRYDSQLTRSCRSLAACPKNKRTISEKNNLFHVCPLTDCHKIPNARQGNKVFETTVDFRTRLWKAQWTYAKIINVALQMSTQFLKLCFRIKKVLLKDHFNIEEGRFLKGFKSKMSFSNGGLRCNRCRILMRMLFAKPVNFKNLLRFIFDQFNVTVRFFRFNREYDEFQGRR